MLNYYLEKAENKNTIVEENLENKTLQRKVRLKEKKRARIKKTGTEKAQAVGRKYFSERRGAQT